MQHRHGQHIEGQTEKLMKAFAEFLMGSDPDDKHYEVIRKDMQIINRRLGKGWSSKFNVLPQF